jgi:hypothetical protein
MLKAQTAHNQSTTDNPCQNPLIRDRRFRFESRVGFKEIVALSRNVKEWVKLCGIDRERVYKDSGLAGVSGLPA